MHQPVLLNEIIEFLAPCPGGSYVDGTLGAGGHAEAILKASSPDGRLFGFDLDEEAINFTQAKLLIYGDRFRCWHAGYHQALSILNSLGVKEVNGIVIDLGLSSDQLEDQQRGFSFRFLGPLDMRFDKTQTNSAQHLLNDLSEIQLEQIISDYGEEPRARKIAQRLKAAIGKGSLTNTYELSEIILKSVGRKRGKIHPATRVFQALRIA
ncbi:MAG: 16S rRNA (cytosine(1402)-N(4))-methyltransferase RsmH, partial [Desulfomonilaceae bacterium]